jgi:hypothetical protein
MRHREQHADGDAHERGEPAPPATIPRQRKDAWLKGWADQRAFVERQAAAKPPNRGKRHKAGAK